MKKLLGWLALSFSVLSVSASAEEKPADGRLFELRTYHAAPGKLEDLKSRFRDHTVALFSKHGMTNVGYWVPVENDDNLLIYLMAYPDKTARDSSWETFLADPDWKKAHAESEVDGKLVEEIESVFMTATDFSKSFGDLDEGGHLFEMRTYTATPGNLAKLHSRFRDETMTVFETHGMTNLMYFELAPDQPGSEDTLIYFLAHKDAAAAEKSWDDFRSDPEWIAAKMASEKPAGGSLTAPDGVKSVYLKATDFSPVK